MRDTYPRNEKWMGTIDYAVARLNTLILRLINTPLRLDECFNDITRCQQIIDEFVKNVRRYYKWPIPFKWYFALRIHRIGKKQIPRIRSLLNSFNE